MIVGLIYSIVKPQETKILHGCLSIDYHFNALIFACSIFCSYFAPIMRAFCSLLLPSYYAKNFAGKINWSLLTYIYTYIYT